MSLTVLLMEQMRTKNLLTSRNKNRCSSSIRYTCGELENQRHKRNTIFYCCKLGITWPAHTGESLCQRGALQTEGGGKSIITL